MVCGNCEGWGCRECANERAAAAGGEQGPTAIELEVEQLKAELAALRAETKRIVNFVVGFTAGKMHKPWHEVLKSALGVVEHEGVATQQRQPSDVGVDANGSPTP